MPTYEYACKACGEHLEVVQSFKDDALTECPACGGPLRKVFGNIGVAFKGSGFYKTDSRSSSRAAKPAASGESGSKSDSLGVLGRQRCGSQAGRHAEQDRVDLGLRCRVGFFGLVGVFGLIGFFGLVHTVERGRLLAALAAVPTAESAVPTAEIGVIGGSGFYQWLEGAVEVTPATPYGPPSGPISIGNVGDRSVAFLARHGRRHQLAPHAVNARANVWALRELGVQRVIGP